MAYWIKAIKLRPAIKLTRAILLSILQPQPMFRIRLKHYKKSNWSSCARNKKEFYELSP